MISKMHKGIRPSYPIALINWKKSIYLEDLPNGDYRVWNTRMLNSGCGKTLTGDEISLMGCIYCPTCDEYFNEEQWVEVSGERLVEIDRDESRQEPDSAVLDIPERSN